jgi:hypothetical protein
MSNFFDFFIEHDTILSIGIRKNPNLSFLVFKNLNTPFWYFNCEWMMIQLLVMNYFC